MVSDTQIREQLEYVLKGADFPELGKCYRGKVRDNYVMGDKRIIVTSDRLSCFDVVVAHIPFKGEVLNRLAVHWFGKTMDIVRNHLIDNPDPNVMIVENCEVLPIEVIVRSYLAGSAWRSYKVGETVSGIRFPVGMKEYQKLPELVLTPSTKAEQGAHDETVSEEYLISSGTVERKLWEQIHKLLIRKLDKNHL